MSSHRRKTVLKKHADRQRHAHAYKHAKAILIPVGAVEQQTNTERRRSGRRFVVSFSTDDGKHIEFTFHLDPHFRLSAKAGGTVNVRLSGCSDRNIVKRQLAQLAAIRPMLQEAGNFRALTLMTAALSFDPFKPAANP